MVKRLLIFFVLISNFNLIHCQFGNADTLLATTAEFIDYILYQNHDTSYIRSYSEQLSVKILAYNNYNRFQIEDKTNGTKINYRPDLGVNFGFGLAYRWFALNVATKIGIKENSLKNSRYSDIQARIFTSKQYFRLGYQYYSGYKIGYNNWFDQDVPDDVAKRDDIRTMQVDLEYLHIFNYGKFSIKAPFVQNEKQKKSAGSLIAGAGFHMYILDSDSSLIPDELQSEFAQPVYFTDFNVVSVLFNIGYVYSFVIRENFLITLGFRPGIGINTGDYRMGTMRPLENKLALRTRTISVFGYNGEKFFCGLQFSLGLSHLPVSERVGSLVSEGRSVMYFGYRF